MRVKIFDELKTTFSDIISSGTILTFLVLDGESNLELLTLLFPKSALLQCVYLNY